MEPTKEEASSKKPVPPISIEINKKKKKSTPPPPPPKRTPPNIDRRNSYPRREEKDTTFSRVQETLEDERIVQQISNLSSDRKLIDHHQRVFQDIITTANINLARTRKQSKPNRLKVRVKDREERRDYNYDHQVESKCEAFVDTKEGGKCDQKVGDLTSCLSGWKVKRRRSGGPLELKEASVDIVEEELEFEFEFDEEMLEAAESLLMLRYGRRSCMVEEDSRSNRKCLSFDLNQPPPTNPEDEEEEE